MGHIEVTRDLAASPEALWATVSDPQTWEKWFTVHETWVEEPPSTLTQGAKLTDKIVMLGMANNIQWAIESIEAPRRLVMGGTGMAGVKAEFAFSIEPMHGGSTFTVTGDFEGALIRGALGKAVEKDGLKQLKKTIDRLDALAFSEAASPA